MPKRATYKVGALNLTIHPHSAEKYAALFKDAFQFRKPLRLHGDIQGVIHTVFDLIEGHPEKGLHGNLIKYTSIDPSNPWYDVSKGKVATKQQLDELSIPDGLAPNMKWTRYFFDPVHHKIIWVCQGPGISFSTSAVWKMFTSFFQHPTIVKDYGIPEITVEQDRDRLAQIFEMFRIEKLTIEYSRPNPDDDDDEEAEKAVEEKLRAQKIQTVQTIYSSEHHAGISPDKSTRALSRLALSNGCVRAKGKDAAGKRLEESTENHPWSLPFRMEQQKTNLALWLPQVVPDIIKALLK